ncbi:uncharacterized protein LOC113232642 [Hyposmocoma kahamanoa]|uniref:uncharacterized protein LOC113232642 n=1 Tax=Hyposmocoma kahamanoa TaxID=1477025 RepID=UPI000E6D60D7|nr:uncharacterized protein LOC113232642 [Hyposmocoma kahamanoa]
MWNVGLDYLLELDEMVEDHRARWAERVAEKQRMRADQNPFDMDNYVFIDLFRLTPDSTMNIVEELRPDLERQRSSGLSVERLAVTEALNRHMLHRHARFPMTPEERHAAKSKFMNARQPFPGTLGVIDYTYVNIIAA